MGGRIDRSPLHLDTRGSEAGIHQHTCGLFSFHYLQKNTGSDGRDSEGLDRHEQAALVKNAHGFFNVDQNHPW